MSWGVTGRRHFHQITVPSCSRTQLCAISVGSVALKKIQLEGRLGRVHSIFRRAFNILTEDTRIITVVQEELGRGPTNIVLGSSSSPDMTRLGIRVNDTVLRTREIIEVGNRVTISLTIAKEWKCPQTIKGPCSANEEIYQSLCRVIRMLTFRKQTIGFAGLARYIWAEMPLKTSNSQAPNAYAQRAYRHILMLQKSIREGNFNQMRTSVQGIAGLGPGLTPAGDDLLSGMMVGLSLFARSLLGRTMLSPSEVLKVNSNILQCCFGKTNLISKEFLVNAASGQTNELIIKLIRNILRKPNKANGVIREVLAIGASSGEDFLLGLLLGSRLQLNIEKN